MATKVIVISDDVAKSKVIGELITNTLVLRGFSNVEERFEAVSPEKRSPKFSLLDAIEQSHPNFLQEPVSVHAIKVEGMDVNGYDEDDEEYAFQNRESAKRDKFGDQFHTTVSLFEDRPSKAKEREQRFQEAAERQGKLHAIVSEIRATVDSIE